MAVDQVRRTGPGGRRPLQEGSDMTAVSFGAWPRTRRHFSTAEGSVQSLPEAPPGKHAAGCGRVGNGGDGPGGEGNRPGGPLKELQYRKARFMNCFPS